MEWYNSTHSVIFTFILGEKKERVFLFLFWKIEYLMESLELNIIDAFILENFFKEFFSPVLLTACNTYRL